MLRLTLPFLVLILSTSFLNAQPEDNWAISFRGGYGGTTAKEAITEITFISAGDASIREVDLGMMKGYSGGIDFRNSVAGEYLFSASLDVLNVNDEAQVYGNTNAFIEGRGRNLTEENSYLAATAAIGLHYRITEDDSKLDWQVGGLLTYSWFVHNYQSAFTANASGSEAISTSTVINTRNTGKREGLSVEMKMAYLFTPRIGLGITGRYGLEGRDFNRARMLVAGLQYSFGD